MPPRKFRDRGDAGQQLAGRLSRMGEDRPLVLGLTRGGVPVAAQVAHVLDAPLDILVVRKLGVPSHREFAFGALAEDGVQYLNSALLVRLGITSDEVAIAISREGDELRRRVALYRAVRPQLDLEGRTVIVVDDGLATGASARAACGVTRVRGAARTILAVPVASPQAVEEATTYADEFVSVITPPGFSAVGEWYEDFDQCDDAQVIDLLREAAGAD